MPAYLYPPSAVQPVRKMFLRRNFSRGWLTYMSDLFFFNLERNVPKHSTAGSTSSTAVPCTLHLPRFTIPV